MADPVIVYRLKEIVTYEIVRVELSNTDEFERTKITRPFAKPMTIIKAHERLEILAKRDAKRFGKNAVKIVGTAKNWRKLIRENAPDWWF